jgi:SAM-dependent methyltransferase
VLSVDYDRLGLRAGERLLDLGCGGGRHAYEAIRRGARVTALDASEAELKDVSTLMSELTREGDGETDGSGAVVCADALAIPFRDGSFDRVIAAEVLEHLSGDQVAMAELARVLRPGGSLAVTVPRFGPEAVNWALSEAYHSVEGGHVRIYRRSSLLGRLRRVGLRLRGSHHAHALHSPYWWLRCAVGVDRDHHPLVRAYHRLLVWDIVRAPFVTRAADRLLNPLLGKSLVLYLDRPA